MLTFSTRFSLIIFFLSPPKKTQAGRGYHPRNVFVDEADWCSQFLTVILPLLSEKNVGLIAMSSPNYSGGVYSTIISAADGQGRKLVNSMILGNPCDLCVSMATPERCNHKLCEMASWKDPERTEYLRKLYTAIGQERIYRAELGTMATVANLNEFSRDMYIDFASSEPKVCNDKIESVYIGVDPAYGGACDFAVTAIGQVTSGTKPGFQVIRRYESLSIPSSTLSPLYSMGTYLETWEVFIFFVKWNKKMVGDRDHSKP
jgi:hypothetical protein